MPCLGQRRVRLDRFLHRLSDTLHQLRQLALMAPERLVTLFPRCRGQPLAQLGNAGLGPAPAPIFRPRPGLRGLGLVIVKQFLSEFGLSRRFGVRFACLGLCGRNSRDDFIWRVGAHNRADRSAQSRFHIYLILLLEVAAVECQLSRATFKLKKMLRGAKARQNANELRPSRHFASGVQA